MEERQQNNLWLIIGVALFVIMLFVIMILVIVSLGEPTQAGGGQTGPHRPSQITSKQSLGNVFDK